MSKPYTKVHKCVFTSEIVAEFRNKHHDGLSGKITTSGSGITIWRQVCQECKNTFYSVSHWEKSIIGQGHADVEGHHLLVRTPPPLRVAPKEARKEAKFPSKRGVIDSGTEVPPRDRPRRRRNPKKNG